MTGGQFDDLKSYVGFGDREAALLAATAGPLNPHLPAIADAFYDHLWRHPGAKAVLREGETQIRRLRMTLLEWMHDLFRGRYDDSYYEKRCAIGRTHVRLEVPQHYVFAGMAVVRSELSRHLQRLDLPNPAERLDALHKLLDLELAILTETFREHWFVRLQEAERAQFLQRISEAEHLANVGQLAASLAHEIKNPLAGISGAIQVLSREMPEDHPRKEILNEALRQIDRLDATVKDLLIYARPKPPSRSTCDLSTLVERALLLFAETPAFADVRVVRDGLDQATHVFVDPDQVHQMLVNLLLNAAHACERGGRINVKLKAIAGGVRLTIDDDGVGMPPDVLQRAFEPFYTTKARGTGLGLSICKRIVEAHEGTIKVESEPNQGTRVIIDLPQTT